jgi:transcriptional regulator with XRE-family HTH domain
MAMSERRTTGLRVLAARESKGLSLRRAARRLGVSPRTLRGWERGRSDIPFAVRQSMVTLYGLRREELISDRRAEAVRDGSDGTIRIGSVTFSAHAADDDSLRAFLAAVRQERGVAQDAPLAVRASDADLLAEVLGGSAEAIVNNLQRLLGVDEREAVELGRWMLRRTAVAGALMVGLVAGVAGTGALAANAADAPAAATGITSSADAADEPVDPWWAEIGDAAVLYRDEAPGGNRE